jgi:hypothetical protein
VTIPEHGILIPYALITRQAGFTVLEDISFDPETPAIKRRNISSLPGSHGDSFRVEL